MTPGNNASRTAAVHTGLWRWDSPVVYFFVCLAIMLGLIAVVLLTLACSYMKSLANSSQNEEGQEKTSKQVAIQVVDYEPRVVVIMAGDNNPTYLAKPVSNSNFQL